LLRISAGGFRVSSTHLSVFLRRCVQQYCTAIEILKSAPTWREIRPLVEMRNKVLPRWIGLRPSPKELAESDPPYYRDELPSCDSVVMEPVSCTFSVFSPANHLALGGKPDYYLRT
jgi:hypothetical protein